jgi:hypothetical protein
MAGGAKRRRAPSARTSGTQAPTPALATPPGTLENREQAKA